MDINNLPFCVTTWKDIEPTTHSGDSGFALWHTQQFGNIRVRMVEYSPGYIADHWCKKGHVLFCIEGELSKPNAKLKEQDELKKLRKRIAELEEENDILKKWQRFQAEERRKSSDS